MLATIVDGAIVLTPFGQAIVALAGLFLTLSLACMSWLALRIGRNTEAVRAQSRPCRRVHIGDVVDLARPR